MAMRVSNSLNGELRRKYFHCLIQISIAGAVSVGGLSEQNGSRHHSHVHTAMANLIAGEGVSLVRGFLILIFESSHPLWLGGDIEAAKRFLQQVEIFV